MWPMVYSWSFKSTSTGKNSKPEKRTASAVPEGNEAEGNQNQKRHKSGIEEGHISSFFVKCLSLFFWIWFCPSSQIEIVVIVALTLSSLTGNEIEPTITSDQGTKSAKRPMKTKKQTPDVFVNLSQYHFHSIDLIKGMMQAKIQPNTQVWIRSSIFIETWSSRLSYFILNWNFIPSAPFSWPFYCFHHFYCCYNFYYSYHSFIVLAYCFFLYILSESFNSSQNSVYAWISLIDLDYDISLF